MFTAVILFRCALVTVLLNDFILATSVCILTVKVSGLTSAPYIGPVSYTHLDVYKRQVL